MMNWHGALRIMMAYSDLLKKDVVLEQEHL